MRIPKVFRGYDVGQGTARQVWSCHVGVCVFHTDSPSDAWRHLWRWHAHELAEMDFLLVMDVARVLGEAQYAFLNRPRGAA